MKTKEKNAVVDYLLTQTTYLLLARSPVKSEFRERSQKKEAELRAMFTPEEFAPIGEMRNVIDQLVRLLVNCDSEEAIQNAHAYIKALNDGEVLIAKEDEQTGEITGYELNS